MSRVVGGRTYMAMAVLCVVVALLAATAAAAGVLGRGDGSYREVTSVRGETYQMATTGVYANNAERIVAEGVGWDYVTLLLAVPVLLAASWLVARGSLRGRLVAMGLLTYFVYQYFQYAAFWALGPLFPLFLAIFPLAALALVWIVSTLDVESLPGLFGERFPRKGMAVFSFAVALLLSVMWAQRIAIGLTGDLEGAALLGQTTLTVQAMDLGIVVPFAIAAGVLVLKRRPWGYLLSIVLAVKGATMATAICAMLLVAASVEGSVEWAPLVIFALVAGVSLWLGVLMLRALPGDRPGKGVGYHVSQGGAHA